MTGAQAMITCLQAEGVSVVFGYPGATIAPFFDELHSSPIRSILVRQEQNAGHAASGYARMTGSPGVCAVTSGPGATNLITGIATAYMDSVPLVAITGQVRTDQLGRDVFQEADIVGATEPFTKHSYIVTKAQDLPRVFKEAFHIASTGRPGPVLIDVPIDVQLAPVDDVVGPETVNIMGYKPSFKGHSLQIKRAAGQIEKSLRPVLCVGGGVFTSEGAQKALQKLAEQTGIPVIWTMMGIGAIPSGHPLSLGMLGTHGVKAANRAVRDADLLILAGARVGDRAMAAPSQIAKRTHIIHIDIDPAEIGKNMPATTPIVGDLGDVLSRLCEQVQYTVSEDWRNACRALRDTPLSVPDRQAGFVEPRAFMRSLSRHMQSDCVLVADVGQNQIWSANHFAVRQGRFLTSGGMGTMGYSVPAAIGAKVASPEKQVCAVCGDGSFQMSMNELATACQSGVNIKIVVMRNGRLGMVRELQDNLYGGRHALTLLDGSPDFLKITAAYGIPSARIDSDDQVDAAIEQMLQTDGPYLLECVVDPAQPSL